MERRNVRDRGSGRVGAKAATQLRVVRTDAEAGYRLIGNIDADNASEFATWLRGALDGKPDGSHGGDVHLHLGNVEFRDTSGIRELVEAARQLDGQGRLILHELPEGLTTAMRAVGWSDLPSMVIADRRQADA